MISYAFDHHDAHKHLDLWSYISHISTYIKANFQKNISSVKKSTSFCTLDIYLILEL